MTNPKKYYQPVPDAPPPPYSAEDPQQQEMPSAPSATDIKPSAASEAVGDAHRVPDAPGSSYQQPFYPNPSPSSPPHQEPPQQYSTFPAEPQQTSVSQFFSRLFLGSCEGGRCSGGACTGEGTPWTEFPKRLSFKQDVHVDIRGHISTGWVEIVPSEKEGVGAIDTEINITPYKDLKDFGYSFDNASGSLKINFPRISWRCIDVKMKIYVPSNARSVRVSVSNIPIRVEELLQVDHLELKTSNSKIKLDRGWKGENLLLQTSNAAVELVGGVQAKHIVNVHTSNGSIDINSDLESESVVSLQSSNGHIVTRNMRAPNITLQTSNSGIKTDSLHAHNITAKTSNDAIILGRVYADGLVDVRTSNSRIDVQVVGEPTQVKVRCKTSNSKIRLNMSKDFVGMFDVKTSSHEKAIVLDHHDPQSLHFDLLQGNHKTGYRERREVASSVELETSNSKAELTFDVPSMHPGNKS